MTPELSDSTSSDILIVDDTPDNIRFLSTMLLKQGYRVRKAISGSMAITAAKTVRPDLILLDINMPEMNGYEVCETLKKDDHTRSIPIIFISALDDIENKVKAFSYGGADYITKPFQFEEVLARIQNQLTIQHLQKQLRERNDQLKTTLADLKNAQVDLIQKEKMAGLGQLVAGVAHQINNPIGFIAGNLSFVRQYIQELLTLIQIYQQEYVSPTPKIRAAIESIDLEFIQSDLEKLTKSMQSGTERLQSIILALRIFSRLDEAKVKPVNLHEGLDSALVLLEHRLNRADTSLPKIAVIKKYGNLPPVICYASELNQVFLNLFNNAIDAFEPKTKNQNNQRNSQSLSASEAVESLTNSGLDRTKPDSEPTIWIRTEYKGENTAVIRIKDNGPGMTEVVRSRIFEPFFTTKPPRSGGGLGLTSSYQIIVEHHRGKLTCWSELGVGTEFIIEIPVRSQTPE